MAPTQSHLTVISCYNRNGLGKPRDDRFANFPLKREGLPNDSVKSLEWLDRAGYPRPCHYPLSIHSLIHYKQSMRAFKPHTMFIAWGLTKRAKQLP